MKVDKTLPSGHEMGLDGLLRGDAMMMAQDHAPDIKELKAQCMDGKLLKCMPSAFWENTPQMERVMLGQDQALYGLPTNELVEFIKTRIGGRTAIEIGSGNGCLGRALGIHRTDNKMQQWPDIIKRYKEGGQKTVFYPNDVKKLDYKKAIIKFKPQVIVASWVTQNDLNVYGMDEDWILDSCDMYIHVGHSDVHSRKKINKRPHQVFTCDDVDFLYSRSFKEKKEIIQIWGK
jgi:hypothetical protein